MLQQIRAGRGGDRRHRRWQIGQPPRVQRKPAHHLEGAGRALRPDGDPAELSGFHHPGTDHIGDVQLAGLLCRCATAHPCRAGPVIRRTCLADRSCREWLDRLVPDPLRRHRDQLLFRIPQRRQLPTEHASGVQTQGVVDPFRFRHRGVAVQHHRPATVVVRPRVSNRQPELVGLAGRIPIQGKASDPCRRRDRDRPPSGRRARRPTVHRPAPGARPGCSTIVAPADGIPASRRRAAPGSRPTHGRPGPFVPARPGSVCARGSPGPRGHDRHRPSPLPAGAHPECPDHGPPGHRGRPPGGPRDERHRPGGRRRRGAAA